MSNTTAPRFGIGQKVTIAPVKSHTLSARDTGLEPYAGQNGKVVDYYWITRGPEVFYIYTVQVGSEQNELVLHEDELNAEID